MNAEPLAAEEVPVPPRPASRRFAWLVLLCLAAAFAAFVGLQTRRLPDRVATHFSASGKADGWMHRVQYRNFTLGLGLGMPVFVLGTFTAIRRMKGWGLNLPNKQYWLEPERQAATFDFIERQGLWLAALLVVFHGVLFHQVTLANAEKPAVLPPVQAFGAVGAFVAVLGAWAFVFIRRFRLPKA